MHCTLWFFWKPKEMNCWIHLVEEMLNFHLVDYKLAFQKLLKNLTRCPLVYNFLFHAYLVFQSMELFRHFLVCQERNYFLNSHSWLAFRAVSINIIFHNETGISFETLALPVSKFLIAFATVSSAKASKEEFPFPNFSFIAFLRFKWGSSIIL